MNRLSKLFITSLITIITTLTSIAHATEPSLKAYISTGKNYLDPTNPGWKSSSKGHVCRVMQEVNLGCSYNERVALVDYLAQNGKILFPCEGRSNPYVKDCTEDKLWHMKTYGKYQNNTYIGQAIQNSALASAITKNKHLFKNGDLTEGNAKKWKM